MHLSPRLTALVTTFALALGGCGKIAEKLFTPSLNFGSSYAKPLAGPASAQAPLDAATLADTVAALDTDLVDVRLEGVEVAALLEALAARARPYRLLVERRSADAALQALLVRDGVELDLGETRAAGFRIQGVGPAQGYLRVDVTTSEGVRRVAFAELATDPNLWGPQLAELRDDLIATQGSAFVMGLPANLGAAAVLLEDAGFVALGGSTLVFARGPLPAPVVLAPAHAGPGLRLEIVR